MRNDETFSRHLSRLKSTLSTHGHDTMCEFLQEHTFLRGKPFNFEGHEYQKQILSDPSQEIVIIKSAQLGISEMSCRLALGKAVLIQGFTTIYTLPSALAAQAFMKTRVDTVIDGSPYLKELVHNATDNSSVKRFGDSYLYLKGCSVDTQAISVPADLLVTDEVDNSNIDTMTLFESRLIHSAFALSIKLSTPSIPNYGIDEAYKMTRRHINMCKCNHCGEWFYPDYFDHVKIPNYKGELKDIVKAHFRDPSFRWMEAYVACPKCGKPADLGPQYREWVQENVGESFVGAGYRISPFDCPAIVKPSAIIRSSVNFERKQDFYNQRLGIPLEDLENSLMEMELRSCIISEYSNSSYSNVLGLDMGTICWCTISNVRPDNQLVIIHKEGIPLFRVVERTSELMRLFRIRMGVGDANPYTETIYQIQQKNRNFFAAIYTNSKNVEMFKIKERDEDADEGIEQLRQVNISRDRGFDLVMGMIRNGGILCVSCKEDETWIQHLTDMKRVKELRQNELVSVWVKSRRAQDHLHHSLLYNVIASRMLGVAQIGGALPLVSSMKHVEKEVNDKDRRRVE